MIEKKTEYRIIEYVFNRKLNLYAFIVLLLLSLIFFPNTLYSFYFGLPIFIMYELLILLFNYNKKNKYIFCIMVFSIVFILIFGLFSTTVLNLTYLYTLVFLLRFQFYFSVHLNKWENWFEYYYNQYMLSPLFIHKLKDRIFNLIKERYYEKV